MTDRARLALQITGYAAFFLLMFVLFLYLGFPYGAIKDLAVQRIEDKTAFRVEIQSFEPNLFTGLHVKDVKVYHNEAVGNQLVAHIEEAKLRFGLMALLADNLNLALDVDMYGGNLSGKIKAGKKTADVDLTFSKIDLGKYDLSPFLSRFGDFRLSGLVDGLVDVAYDAADLRAAKGAAELNFNGLQMEETEVYGMKIPLLNFEPSKIRWSLAPAP